MQLILIIEDYSIEGGLKTAKSAAFYTLIIIPFFLFRMGKFLHDKMSNYNMELPWMKKSLFIFWGCGLF